MHKVWDVKTENYRFELNVSNYVCIFDNFAENEVQLMDDLLEVFQPRSKVRDSVKVTDITEDEEEITHHNFQAFKVSNEKLLEEVNLGAKSSLKSRIKNEFSQHLETDGYLMTINTLVEDLLQLVDSELPLRSKRFNLDLFTKLITIDFDDMGDKKYEVIFQQLKLVLPEVVKDVKANCKTSPILLYYYPENFLSPREQLFYKEMLTEIAQEIPIILLTKSNNFLENDIYANNFLMNNRQLFTKKYLNDMEWDAPIDYSMEDIVVSLSKVFKKYIWQFETYPIISNYRDADIIVFESLDLYVTCRLLNSMGVEYELDLKPGDLEGPVYGYVMDKYRERNRSP
ncbi:hypothetical protein U0355_09095 [Salimicrobium sp. PL1-032A]|uniref:hypothetical protein n=1 Tax=Salimicrobium sp. PL1-032A TaxID=3095364 RepID=UPI00326059BC